MTDYIWECTKCGDYKDRELFPKRGQICRECERKHDREYYLINSECIKCKRRKYVAQNPEKIKLGRKDYYRRNTEACKLNARKWHEANPDKAKLSRIKLAYKITENEWNSLQKQANGQCQICGSTEKKLEVDHDHPREFVRGLLCGDCNKGIGRLKDDVTILKSAIKYLKKSIRTYERRISREAKLSGSNPYVTSGRAI